MKLAIFAWTRAEVVIEKLLCHDRTRGLSISVNDHEWMLVPESDGIPEPQWEYQHHFYPVIDVPLDQLEAGPDNQFRMKIDPESQNWPQNLIYGVHLRVYYDARRKPHPIGRIVAPGGEAPLGESVTITIDALPGAVPVQRIDYLGLFEDVNLEGDGHYRRWHYHYRRGKLAGHIGTASAAPWSIFAHDVLLEDLSILKPGENVLKTGHTPKYNGKMVHGAEINWPGIMVLIQYRR